MKTALWILASLVLLAVLVGVVASVAWGRKTSIAANMLEKKLGVPVSLGSLELTQSNASLTNLTIGNPRHYSNAPAFTAGSIEIFSTLSQIRGNPLVIDKIDADQLFINIETGPKGQTNWGEITAAKSEKLKKDPRHYLIKTLVLTNLTVQVTDGNGKTKRYPTIQRMEFHNISDETGFPVDQIEKAIFNLVMKDLFKKLNIQQLLQPFVPKGFPLPNLFQ